MSSDWKPPVFDPVRYCIFTSVALLAWVFGAPVIVMLMSAIGLFLYVNAYQKGLRRTACFLRDPLIAIAYLTFAFVAGITAMVLFLVHRLS